ncbi:MAG: helix-turn-helix transcriptional regulator [Actinomycetota bacterium]|nr:helix-turn-helix transcriptional regulator [Actinomycetota bacterium]
MSDLTPRLEMPPPGGVAWLDVSAETDAWPGRVRLGPLGLQISRLPNIRAPYFFKGARLRGGRCIWSASTLSGADLHRPARDAVAGQDSTVHILVRAECPGSVFDPLGKLQRGTLRVFESTEEIREQFVTNTHLFTLNLQRGTLGIETASLAEMFDQSFDLTPFQVQLLRSAVGLLVGGSDELGSSASLVGIDRYLGALGGLLLRTSVRRRRTDVEQMDAIRTRTDTIIFDQAVDPLLTPAGIAAQLNISLRQLYRAFNGAESPAARIRRRRLEHAAELLTARAASSQVDKIAQECGFVSAEYFSRAFRREFGLSPRAYRSAHRDRSVTAPARVGR